MKNSNWMGPFFVGILFGMLAMTALLFMSNTTYYNGAIDAASGKVKYRLDTTVTTTTKWVKVEEK